MDAESLQRGTDLWLQTCLRQLVEPTLIVDGKPGPRTTAALKAFQRRAGLVVDGKAGPATIAALEAAMAARTTLHTAAVAAEPEPAAPADTYAERRIGVRLYGTTPDDSPLLVPVPSTTSGRKRLHVLAAAALVKMAAAIQRDLGIEFKLASAWRAHRWTSRQQYEDVLVAKYTSETCNTRDKAIARGKVYLAFDSPHETGLAIDIGVGGLTPSSATIATQRKQPLHKWLVAHAWEYGFHPYKAEPWHWEYPMSLDAFRSGVVADDDPGPPEPLQSYDLGEPVEPDVIEDDDLEEFPTG